MNFLMWWFLVPLFLSAGFMFLAHKKFSNQRYSNIGWVQCLGMSAGLLLIGVIILSSAYGLGRASKKDDVEIFNGEVTGKFRVHGSYERAYSCNCRTTGSGSNSTTTCDTCYEEHYTVNWDCASNIGTFGIDSRDSTSSWVYNTPDPRRYVQIKIGDPVAKQHHYVNYIKAVPDSLFQRPQGDLLKRFKDILPNYPDVVYDIYHVNRVIATGLTIKDNAYWNAKLEDTLKKLGPSKQANAVIIITNSSDPTFFDALQDKWVGGKKNDVALVIGASHFPGKADWVRVMALTQDNLFQVKLRDDILALDQLTADKVIGTLQTDTYAYFKRKHMKDFKYLDAEIQPPGWVMNLALFLVLLEYGIAMFVLFKTDDY